MWVKVMDGDRLMGGLVQDIDNDEWLFIARDEESDVYGREFTVCGEFGQVITVTMLPGARPGLRFEVMDGRIRFSDEEIVKLREL